MSKLRPELCDGPLGTTLSNDDALYLIRKAVARRRLLIRGRLHDGEGHHCALGAFWADNPGTSLNHSLVDEVAAVNDSLPKSASPRERWRLVNAWLRLRVKMMAQKQ